MLVRNIAVNAACLLGVSVFSAGAAQAQIADRFTEPQLVPDYSSSFSVPGAEKFGLRSTGLGYFSDGGSSKTILLVSAIVAVIGVLDDNSALIVIGGVGIIVSLVESNGFGYRARPQLDLLKMGSLSFGLSPVIEYGPEQAVAERMPGLFLQTTYRF